MPNVYRHTVESLLKLCERALKSGVRAIAPFPHIEQSKKSPHADEALSEKSIANRAISAVKKRFPEMAIIADTEGFCTEILSKIEANWLKNESGSKDFMFS